MILNKHSMYLLFPRIYSNDRKLFKITQFTELIKNKKTGAINLNIILEIRCFPNN